MTENEALEYIKNMAFMCGEYEKCQYGHQCTTKCLKATEIAIKALEEIQQYRAIGTVEDIQSMKDNGAFSGVELAQLAVMQMRLRDYQAIGTIDEFKALKEKNTPYKPKEYEDRYYACKCDNILLPKWRKYPTELMTKSEGLPHCMACGQKLDWQ